LLTKIRRLRLGLLVVFALLAQQGGDCKGARIAPISFGQNFSVQVTQSGGLLVTAGRETYAIESNFSYPNMPPERWNTLGVSGGGRGEWNMTLTQRDNGFQILGTGRYYRLRRTVTIEQDHLRIEDAFTNLTDDALGIAFDNRVRPTRPPAQLHVSGPYKQTHYPYVPSDPAWNPTLYFAGDRAGLGIVALDDFYRLQLALKRDGDAAWLENRSFGLPPHDTYTFVWAVYPTASADYYDFINAVRRDAVPNYPLEGSCAFLEYELPTLWPKEKMADWLKQRAAKMVILIGPYSGGPWLGEDSNYIYKVPNFNLDAYLQTLKKARQALKAIDPQIKCLAPFETALSPDLAPGDTKVRFPDSVSILPDGTPAGYRWPQEPEARQKFLQNQGHQYIYYPTLTNSYYAFVRDRIQRALHDAEMDGIYFDLFSYAYGDHGFRWTYDRWDNRTVDLDPKTYTLRRKKADLCKLTEDARAALVQTILDAKPGNVVVANDMGVASKIRALPIYHFRETMEDYGYVTTHFSTPIILGWTPDFFADAKSIGKEGDWWREWKTDKDYFEDIKDKLRSGCLYYTYIAPPGKYGLSTLTHPTLLSHMFPITIQELHAGWIQGKERILTLLPGRYSWHDQSQAVAYGYDSDGKECPAQLTTITNSDGTHSFEVRFPEGGAAVLEKR